MLQTTILAAKLNWESVISSDEPPVNDLNVDIGCGVINSVDNLNVCLREEMSNGSDGVVASASPNYVNVTTKLPITCLLEFYTADVELSMRAEEFILVLTHEIGHCLGLGTMWEYLDLVNRDVGGDYVYRDGTNACQ